MRFEELKAEALKLPEGERHQLAHSLILSLNGETEPDPEIQQLWLDEAERRYQDIVEGRVQPIPLDEALQSIRDSL
jgi:putative addiction module component (TIGR02574 family)